VSAWCARQRPVRTVRTVFRGSSYPPFRVCPAFPRQLCGGEGVRPWGGEGGSWRSMRRAKPRVVPLLASGA
jgi:hypothetical protein